MSIELYRSIRRLRPYFEKAADRIDVLPADMQARELRLKIEAACDALGSADENDPLREELSDVIEQASLRLDALICDNT